MPREVVKNQYAIIRSMFLSREVRKMRDVEKLYPTLIAKALGVNHSRYIQKLYKPEELSIKHFRDLANLLDIHPQVIMDIIMRELSPTVNLEKKEVDKRIVYSYKSFRYLNIKIAGNGENQIEMHFFKRALYLSIHVFSGITWYSPGYFIAFPAFIIQMHFKLFRNKLKYSFCFHTNSRMCTRITETDSKLPANDSEFTTHPVFSSTHPHVVSDQRLKQAFCTSIDYI